MTQAVRRSRRTAPIDVEQFRSYVDKALAAFRKDFSYSEAMAKQAVTIRRKRDVWQLRRDGIDQARPEMPGI